MTTELNQQNLRAVILTSFPELAHAEFTLLTAGWDSVAVDVDNRIIFKFPRDSEAEQALQREASLLAAVRLAVDMPVPELTIHSGPPLFSHHLKIPGEHLQAWEYPPLTGKARTTLAAAMALFYYQLHGLSREKMTQAGAQPIGTWLGPEEILRRSWPALSGSLRLYAERAVTAWQNLPQDPHGQVYGFFDGHGWNMAFDHHLQKLNGIYDFADSGFGSVHQEFIYTSWISRELTENIVAEYERLSGLSLDRERIELLSSVIRLSELAEYVDDVNHAPIMLQTVVDWSGYETNS